MYAFHGIGQGRWNASHMRHYISDPFSVTILRNPVEMFESLYSYIGLDNQLKMNINQYAEALQTDPVRLVLIPLRKCFLVY